MEFKKKNIIIKTVIIIILILTVSWNRNSQMDVAKVSRDLYEFDKKNIAEAYLNNIEYYRLHYPYNLELRLKQAVQVTEGSAEEKEITEQLERHFQKYPKVKNDPAKFYKPYACRYSLKINDYVNSPVPTRKQVSVSTDSIIYNKDASLCIAFLCIEYKFDDIEGLESRPHTFSAAAMVGYRKHPKDTLKTYPLSFYRLMVYDKKKTIVGDLIELYSTRLKGRIEPWSIYGNVRFNHNVGEKKFFKESPLFMKYNDSTYYFQMYRALGEDFRYDYPY